MIDFKIAFNKGQTAAEVAKNNNQEINAVFTALNEQLAEVTNGKVHIVIDNPPLKAKLSDQTQIGNIIKSRSLTLPQPFEKEKYRAICAKTNAPKEEIRELAIWEKGREGYPCKITIGNKQHYCEDKIELEETLALMLEDPIVAGILADVMRLSEKQAA